MNQKIPKLRVEGSIPFTRSIFPVENKGLLEHLLSDNFRQELERVPTFVHEMF
jgi:hypothetical protein